MGDRAGVPPSPAVLPPLSLQRVATDVLDIAYFSAGPEEGKPVVLLHDLLYGPQSYARVARLLAAQGLRVLVPHLRGHGQTVFRDAATPRSGQQAAFGLDAIALIDALHIPEAVFAGFGWGATAACAVAVLKPTRCAGLVSVDGYQLDDPARLAEPLAPEAEARLWHQYYLQTERGRAGLAAYPRAIARSLWQAQSRGGRVDAAAFELIAGGFDNPDLAAIVTHAHRHRFGSAAGDPRYGKTESKLALRPAIAVPAITLAAAPGDSPAGTREASGAAPAAGTLAAGFRGPHSRRQLAATGHHVPHEAPQAFADAVADLAREGHWRT
ncbi:alpha/beta hydrolase [Pseudoduganella sp. LjRoot289]|uniref:alpha/beta fold hydrolase n=1 Tax=Pseudoduganella sp. LjRoot289 TaxID=3342314 RepID=UPI003ECD64CA